MHHRADDLFDSFPHRRTRHRANLLEQRLDSCAQLAQLLLIFATTHQSSTVFIIVGEWIFFSTFPLPTYMCTPHGRHGSKLRTVRIMSMPLNLSGPFSSKIGVFCTASSYGPGVPNESRGL